MRNPVSNASPVIHEIMQLGTVPSWLVNPETIYAINEITATESAYGSCEET